MTAVIYEINDLSKHEIIDILKEGLYSASENYSYKHCKSTSNLFYILEHGRYLDGKYFVITIDGKYVASAGWNKYNDDTALVLTRAYVIEKYRSSFIMGTELLPKMLEECRHFENIWITCNEDNKVIYDWFCRKQDGKSTSISVQWPEIYSNFIPIGIKTIYYTEQYILELQNRL